MSTRVINVGPLARGGQNQKNTKNKALAVGDQGTVRVSYENREYVFGPNDSKVLENGVAAALVDQDARLKIADSQDGPKTDVS